LLLYSHIKCCESINIIVHPLSPLHLRRLKSQHYKIITTSYHLTPHHGFIPTGCWTPSTLSTLFGLPFEPSLPYFSILWWLVSSSRDVVSSAYCALALPYLAFAKSGTLPPKPKLQTAGNTVCSTVRT